MALSYQMASQVSIGICADRNAIFRDKRTYSTQLDLEEGDSPNKIRVLPGPDWMRQVPSITSAIDDLSAKSKEIASTNLLTSQ